MTSDSGLKPGAVVVVPFPYADRLSEKRRPALVVSGGQVHAQGLVWLAMITSSTRTAMPGDVPIDDLHAAGLSVPCMVRTIKIACVDADRVIRVSGGVSPSLYGAVTHSLRDHLGMT